MSKLIERLEKLTEFESKLKGYDDDMRKARMNPETRLSELNTLMKAADETANEFNQWMLKEFGFSEGPQIMPTILKTVLESSIETSRIITP